MGWYNSSWSYRKKLTIDNTKVSGSSHSDFPVLVSITDSDLSSLGEGPDSFTKLLLPFDGTDGATGTDDKSGNGHVATFGGNAQIDTAQSKFGGSSLLLDGTGDDVTFPDDADWNFSTGDFSIDLWIRFNSTTGEQWIISQAQGTDNSQWYFRKDSDGNLRFFARDASEVTKAHYITSSAPTLNTGTWYHLEVVRNGSNFYIFLDGTSLTLTVNTAISTNAMPDVPAVLTVGKEPGNTPAVNGWIDELRVSKGVARHTSNFTAPTAAYQLFGDDFVFTSSDGETKLSHEIESYDESTGALIAWVKVPTLSGSVDTDIFLYFGAETTNQEDASGVWDSSFKGVWHSGESTGKWIDSTSNSNDGTFAGTLPNQIAGKIANAQDCNGSSDTIAVTNDGDFAFGTGDFTIEFWFYLDSSSQYEAFLSTFGGSAPTWICRVDNTGKYSFFESALEPQDKTGGSVATGAWHHYAVTRSGGSSTLYIDGTSVATWSSSVNYNQSNDIDVAWSHSSFYMDGKIDEVRISKGAARSEDWIDTEIENINNPGTFLSLGAIEVNGASSDGADFGDTSAATASLQAAATDTVDLGDSATGFVGTAKTTDGAKLGDSVTAEVNPWHDFSWCFRKQITIDSTKVFGTSQTSFPVLVSVTDTDIADHAQADGDDILFASATGVKYDHEIESWNSSTGELVAWVRIPTLSGSVDHQFFCYYGNPGASDQQNVTAVWDSNYIGVWHLSETGTGTRFDSTSNNNDASTNNYNGDEATTGKIDGADDLDGTNDYLSAADSSSLDISGTAITLQAWIYIDSTLPANTGVISKGSLSDSQGVYSMLAANEGDGFEMRLNGSTTIGSGRVTGGDFVEGDKNKWHHLVAAYDGTNQKLYKNGVEVGSETYSSSISTNNESLKLGAYFNIANVYDDKVDEFRVSDVGRSLNWVKTEYNSHNSPSTFMTFGAEESIAGEDGVDLGDTAVATAALEATVADGVKFGDTTVEVFDDEVLVADGTKYGDTTTGEVDAAPTAVDGAEFGDTAGATADLEAVVADGVSLGDTPAETFDDVVTVADGVDLGDTPQAEAALLADTTDGIDLGDTPVATVTREAATSDGADFGDAPVADVIHEVATSDGVTLSDTPVGDVTIPATASDGVSLGDTTAEVIDLAVEASDGVEFADTSAELFDDEVTITDGVEFGDATEATAALEAQTADGVDFGDATSCLSATPTTSVDGAEFGDTAAATLSAIGTSSDGFEMSDTATVERTVPGIATDGIEAGDATTAQLDAEATAQDGIKFADTADELFDDEVTVTDGVKLSDTPIGILSAFSDTSDGIEFADTPEGFRTQFAFVSDGMTSSDAAEATQVFSVVVTDGTLFSDTNSRVLNVLAEVVDGVEFGDATARTVLFDVDASDGINLGDATVTTASFEVQASDTLVAGDTVSRTLFIDVDVTDGTEFGETVDVTATIVTEVSDGIEAGDLTSSTATFETLCSDGMTAGDFAAAVAALVAGAVDEVRLGDVPIATAQLQAQTQDGVEAADSAIATADLLADTTDGVEAGDSTDRTLTITAFSEDGAVMGASVKSWVTVSAVVSLGLKVPTETITVEAI